MQAKGRSLSERGGSVVSFVLALPILLAFFCAAVDLGRAVFLGMALEDAAYAACRAVCSEGAEGATSDALRDAVLLEAPALSGDIVSSMRRRDRSWSGRRRRRAVPFASPSD